MSKILGLIDLEPRKHTKADLNISKDILQRNTPTTFGYGSLVLIEIFWARCFIAVFISEHIPPDEVIPLFVFFDVLSSDHPAISLKKSLYCVSDPNLINAV